MCEIFGFSSKNHETINKYLKEFYSHCENHPHGWGFASMDEKKIIIEKEPIKATESEYLKNKLTRPVKVKNAFAHIRYATMGYIDRKNCHPYTKKDNGGRIWTLIHNGTIFNYKPLNKYVKTQIGETDSERILLHIIDKVNANEKIKGNSLNEKELFELLDSIISKMSLNNKLNLMIYNGEYMYVHTNLKNSLSYLKKDNNIMFSTSPLTDENWKEVPFTQLLAYKEGELAFEGTNHHNAYVENEKDLKHLYQIFSSL